MKKCKLCVCRAPYLRALDGPHALNGPARAVSVYVCTTYQYIRANKRVRGAYTHTRTCRCRTQQHRGISDGCGGGGGAVYSGGATQLCPLARGALGATDT